MFLRYALLLILIATSGCDQITGADEKKSSDAEAIGYACRVSVKKPEDCMKENEAQSTTSILAGWKSADKDIQERTLDPSMGSDPAYAVVPTVASAPAATETNAEASAPEKSKAADKKPEKSH